MPRALIIQWRACLNATWRRRWAYASRSWAIRRIIPHAIYSQGFASSPMAEPRFLLVRLGSLGDIVHALPAASALRDTFPDTRIDWVVDRKWMRLLEGNPDISETIV